MNRPTAIIITTLLACTLVHAQEVLIPIADQIRLEPNEQQTIEFAVKQAVLAQRPALRLLMRLDRERLGGSTYAARIWVNETRLDVRRLLNKPPDARMLSGQVLPWEGKSAFRAVYSPDYEAANRGDQPMCIVGGKAYEFVLDVADLLGEGANTLRILHIVPNIPQALVIKDIALVERPEAMPETESEIGRPAPTGELPLIAPEVPEPVAYTIEPLDTGGFTIVAGESRMPVRSAFTWPGGGWNLLAEAPGEEQEADWAPRSTPRADGGLKVTAAGRAYRLERTVEPLADHVAVSDRFVNTSGAPLHISLRYGLALDGVAEPQVWLHGSELLLPSGNFAGGDNPSALVSDGRMGFGMLAEDDVLRAQCRQVADPDLGEAGLVDHSFMIRAGEEYTIRWSVYVVPGGDYWTFVNAVRRNWSTNFTIDGPFAFVSHPSREELIPDLAAWLDNSGVRIVSTQIPQSDDKQLYHGLAFLGATEEQQRLREQMERIRELRPDVDVVCYIDIYVTSLDGAPEDYPDARHLGADGQQHAYPGGNWKGTMWMFVPTTENDYGRAMAQYFDLCTDTLGFDGIYWDQVSHPGRPIDYGRSDGHTCISKPENWGVEREVALIPLASMEYQAQQARRVLDAGEVLIGNSQPETETMTRIHFPRFVEAWHPSRLQDAHLYCPLGLASPDRIRSEDDIAANIREHLMYGGLWYYYVRWNAVQLTHPTITAHMFPFTPIELHSGYLIGEERILTAKSGMFGWGDASEHEAFVYDELGYLQEDFEAPTRTIDGETYTELRLPGGWLAAIVRR